MGHTPQRLIDYFDRLYIIHLPERTDRYVELERELWQIGIEIDDPRVAFMHGSWPDSSNGFASVGVYSNFMCHLRILREAKMRRLRRVWILEDDAIFRHALRSPDVQRQLVGALSARDWEISYIGHRIDAARTRYAAETGNGVELFQLEPDEEFLWAHCYAVSADGIDRLLPYLEETLRNPPGHRRGGRMYIDGALNMFRRLHPHAQVLACTPNLSSQRGTVSSLGDRRAYDNVPALRPLVRASRALRDELWRRELIA